MYDDVVAHAGHAAAEGGRDGQFLGRVPRAIGAAQMIDRGQAVHPRGGVVRLTQELAGPGVDQDRQTGLALHKEDTGRQVGHQRVEHARGAAQVVGQRPLHRDVAEHAVPPFQLARRAVLRRQGVTHPALPFGRRRDGDDPAAVGGRQGSHRPGGDSVPRRADRGQAVFTGDRPVLPPQLGQGSQHHLLIVRVDVGQPARKVAQQGRGVGIEQGAGGGTDEGDLGQGRPAIRRPLRHPALYSTTGMRVTTWR